MEEVALSRCGVDNDFLEWKLTFTTTTTTTTLTTAAASASYLVYVLP